MEKGSRQILQASSKESSSSAAGDSEVEEEEAIKRERESERMK